MTTVLRMPEEIAQLHKPEETRVAQTGSSLSTPRHTTLTEPDVMDTLWDPRVCVQSEWGEREDTDVNAFMGVVSSVAHLRHPTSTVTEPAKFYRLFSVSETGVKLGLK